MRLSVEADIEVPQEHSIRYVATAPSGWVWPDQLEQDGRNPTERARIDPESAIATWT
jgi:hypothetical protein